MNLRMLAFLLCLLLVWPTLSWALQGNVNNRSLAVLAGIGCFVGAVWLVRKARRSEAAIKYPAYIGSFLLSLYLSGYILPNPVPGTREQVTLPLLYNVYLVVAVGAALWGFLGVWGRASILAVALLCGQLYLLALNTENIAAVQFVRFYVVSPLAVATILGATWGKDMQLETTITEDSPQQDALRGP